MTPTNPTTHARAILRGISLAFIWSAGCLAYGQTAATPTTSSNQPTLNEDEAVELPKFEITAEADGRYQSQQALSASRVATAIVDIPQTISVIPKELLEDSKGNRMLDVAKYVTPITESTLPFGGDRYTIRGFQVSAEFVDGTNISGADGYSMSQAPYNIERLEVIKGPNAILVPGGSPGGVMNPITKSPLSRNAGSVNVNISPYLGNDVWFDVNRLLDKDGKLALRLVAAVWKTDYYIDGQFRKGYEVSPSFSYQISPAHKFILKADFVQNRETNLGGVPVDPNVGTDGSAKIAAGLPRDWMFGNDTDSRHRATERITAELLSTLGEHVTSRLFVMADHVRRIDVGGTSAAIQYASMGGPLPTGYTASDFTNINPYTGRYEPGVYWNTPRYTKGTDATLVSTTSPITGPSSWIYTRGNGKVDLEYTEAHIKNDYAALFNTQWFKTTTIWGFTANTSKVRYRSWPTQTMPAVAANNLAAIQFPGYNFTPEGTSGITAGLTTDNRGTDRTGRQNDLQMYAMETISVWGDRIQLTGGVSRFFGDLTRTDTTATAILPALPDSPSYDMTTNATSFGIVVKPIKPVSLFYSRNTTGGSMPGSLNAGVTDPNSKIAQGGQKEFGIKTSFLNGKVTASFAHFDIAQKNYAVTNSLYYSLIAQGRVAEANALPQALYVDLNSKGWEFEATYSYNKNLTILGNVTDYKVRQPITNVRLRGVPDRAFGLYADYRFTTGVMKGFGVNLGIDYKSDVAGENATGYTTGTKPLPDGSFVPIQPSFIVAERTLANLGVSYKRGAWAFSTTIVNLLDKDYILSAGSRTSVLVGTPRTFKSTISYTF